MLWFAAPPSDLVHVPPPRHSLKYLAFLAKKRKREQRGAGPDAGGAIDVDADEALRPRKRMPPTVTEQLEALMREHGLDQVSVS